ncbi:MAG: OB-fold domain-containing protein, partial [Anaerolineales bacterium]|nr:OB-fold domain-containing protein [Anaerolineales bacterium]
MDIPRHWRLKKQRYSLTGEVCEHCDAKLFPPRDICPECGEEAKTLFQFSGKGEVYSFTTVYDAPEGYAEQAPYTLAMVKLAEGPLVTAQLTDL